MSAIFSGYVLELLALRDVVISIFNKRNLKDTPYNTTARFKTFKGSYFKILLSENSGFQTYLSVLILVNTFVVKTQ